MELKHKEYWAVKVLNFDLQAAWENQFLQLCELDELTLEAYESSSIYKEWTKHWQGRHIMKKKFHEGDMVLLFNSNLKLFPGKLRSQWLGPFQVTKVHQSGAVEV